MKHLATCVLLLIALEAIIGCGSSSHPARPTTPTLSSLTVTPNAATILTGATQQLGATAQYSDGSSTTAPQGLTWTSSNTALATVNSSGLVTAIAPGAVQVTASLSNLSGVSALTVQTVLATLDRSTDLAGPDTNGNGVRDDIDQVIASYKLSTAQTQALTQFAASVQKLMLSTPDSNSAYQNTQNMYKAQVCVFNQLGNDGASYTHQLKAFTFDTQARVTAYITYLHDLGGAVIPRPTGNVCN